MSPVTYVSPNPSARVDGFYAVYVLHDGHITPLLLSELEFDRARLRAKGRHAGLLPPRPMPDALRSKLREESFSAKTLPRRNWFQRLVDRIWRSS